ncbi:MAG: hypothetical protein HYR94_17170 [Chloroflexi bacterium]|nr:hypothetical protein [Chloroflexota bacterium]
MMLQIASKACFAILMVGPVVIFTACTAGLPTQEDIPPVTPVEAQSVPESTPVNQPEPTVIGLPNEISSPETSPINPPEPTPTGLPTEIVEPGSPVAPPAVTPADRAAQPVSGSEAAVAAAIADLSKQTGVPADQITVNSVEPMNWPDTSLGCPQEGMMYAQVITPGYLIVLTAQGQQYEYHTDQQATNVVLCNK